MTVLDILWHEEYRTTADQGIHHAKSTLLFNVYKSCRYLKDSDFGKPCRTINQL